MQKFYDPIQWASKSVEGRQKESDGSRLYNFYAVALADPKEAKVPVMLLSSPGQRRYLKLPTHAVGEDGVHFMLEFNSPVYGRHLIGLCNQYQFFDIEVGPGKDIARKYNPFSADTALHEISSVHDYTSDAQEAVPADEPRKMVTDGRRVVWVANNNIYLYDYGKQDGAGFVNVVAPTPANLSTLKDQSDQDWVDCEWIDGYFLIASKSGQFWHSQNDSEQFDQLDFSRASANPDGIVGLAQLNRRLYIIGTQSIETWFNSGGADFAFDRDNSFTINVGCIARSTIATNIVAIIFIGSDLIVYAMAGSQISRISTDNVDYDIDRSDPYKARAYTYTEEGHHFYSLTLTFEDGLKKNWTYDFTSGAWHERGDTENLCGTRFVGIRNLIGRAGKRHIFDQNLDWGIIEEDEGENPIEREAISPVMFSDIKRINMSAFYLDVPIRTGGKRKDYIVIDWSDDGGRVWKGSRDTEGVQKRKRLDSGPRIRVSRMGQLRIGRNIRIRTKAARRVDVLGAYLSYDVLKD